MRVLPAPDIDPEKVQPGSQVVLNESLNVVEVLAPDGAGEVVKVKDRLGTDRAIVLGRGDEEHVAYVAGELLDKGLRAGDAALFDPRSVVVTELLPREEVEELVLEEIPDVTYEDIGGLEGQIELIRDAVELPFLYAELFNEHQLEPPKGVLLYGPPGCGKTLIAKAVANSLAEKVAERSGRDDARSYFLNVKGPELLNKYVGETERQIRVIFIRAQGAERRGPAGHRVLRRDGLDVPHPRHGHLLRRRVDDRAAAARRDRRRRDPEERDRDRRVEPRGPDRPRDPAPGPPRREDQDRAARTRPRRWTSWRSTCTRPCRSTPTRSSATAATSSTACHRMIEKTVEQMYADSDENRFLEVTYATGDKEILYFKDFSSGAMIENIVRRAKKLAIKRFLSKGEKGIKGEDLFDAIREEFKENEDLPNTTNPDDWAKISGKKGERIVYVRTLLGHDGDGRQVERVSAGQYL